MEPIGVMSMQNVPTQCLGTTAPVTLGMKGMDSPAQVSQVVL